ncbi:MAG: hypothetical protein KatS3mg030_486 [Saprospiraceae bacterium]|nr:MAG: hypothetical protein KatS3mg030_486 [Saprospiraceae bacterium]
MLIDIRPGLCPISILVRKQMNIDSHNIEILILRVTMLPCSWRFTSTIITAYGVSFVAFFFWSLISTG